MAGPIELIEQSTAELERVVKGVKPDQLGNPTPCDEFDVRALLGHIFTGAEMMRSGAATGTGTPAEVELSSDVAKQYADARKALLEAWKSPGVLEKTIAMPFGAMPGQVLSGILFMEAMIHAWDLAKATGQDTNLPDDLVKACLDQMRPMGPMLRGPGVFGPEVEAPAGASLTDQLVAFSGRQP